MYLYCYFSFEYFGPNDHYAACWVTLTPAKISYHALWHKGRNFHMLYIELQMYNIHFEDGKWRNKSIRSKTERVFSIARVSFWVKGGTHWALRRKLSSKLNNSILVEWHDIPKSKVYGVPIERSFYHRKWTFGLYNKVNDQKNIEIHRK